MNERKKSITMYCCATDFNWELGQVKEGNKLFGTVKDLKNEMKCWKECGIVKLKVSLIKYTRRPKPFKSWKL